MSVQTLYTAATGMSALETKLDVIANNLANVETVGFKRGRANFEDLFYRHEMMPGAQDTAGQYTATGISVGMGARVSSTQSNFVQGSTQPTGQELDVTVEGPGFFQVMDPKVGFRIAGNHDLLMIAHKQGRECAGRITRHHIESKVTHHQQLRG